MPQLSFVTPFFIALVVLLFSACRPAHDVVPVNGASADTVAQPKADSVKRYRIRSGILTATTDLPALGSVGRTTIMFDRYGEVERNETVAEVQTGPNTKETARYISITNGNVLYTLLPDEKVAKRVRLTSTGASNTASLDFCRLDSATMAHNNVRRAGTDTVLGRRCDIYIVNDISAGTRGTYYVWNCIPLKIDVDMNGSRMVMKPLSFEVDPQIDPKNFAVPEGYRILDARP